VTDTAEAGVQAPSAGASRWAWVVVDLVCLGAFVVGGLGAHGDSGFMRLVQGVILPYTIGWFAASWAVGLTKEPYSPLRALIAWPFGVAMGLMLRVLFLVGAFPTRVFVLVSLGFLGATLVGWRGIVAAVRAVRSRA